MKWFSKLSKLLKFVLIILIFVVVAFSYFSYKKCEVRIAVEDYLYEELGLSEKEVLGITPNTPNLLGDKHWMAYVKLKDDKKGYFYYKNEKDEVLLESYNLNGTTFMPDE